MNNEKENSGEENTNEIDEKNNEKEDSGEENIDDRDVVKDESREDIQNENIENTIDKEESGEEIEGDEKSGDNDTIIDKNDEKVIDKNNTAQGRNRGETPEEKKARKKLVKDMQKIKRLNKVPKNIKKRKQKAILTNSKKG